ncbi:MAG: SOS response-associated peptidase [Gammaproteobacteria bacterium]|nr:SOS response-associated peptidase [Gammaproteobacteria bacterium]MBU1440808.1 SOS response-associated peptidase [Gammaproteobacteria bacterium]MBU2409128.1 SOS response-associated peptidase [Gammaproteobacteria bacterium]
MPLHYLATGERRHYAERFGLSVQPASALVKPGDQGMFVRKPRGDRVGSDALARFELVRGRWGLIPLFSKDGLDADTFEARSESAAKERNFLQPWKRGHRCVVLADAIFRNGDADDEWLRVTRADGHPLALAGLWNGWRAPNGDCVESFALLTLPHATRPDQRRVVFLRDAWLDDWLHCPAEETSAYLRLYSEDKLVRRVEARA